MLNIFVHLVMLLNVKAFYLKETYRTKGLKVIDIDLDKHNEFVVGESIVTITLESSGQGSFPVLSYCPTDNLQNIKTIFSSMKQIKEHIESNKKLCVFDNDAVIYEQQLQEIVLSDSLNKQNQWIYNRFSIFSLKNRKISLYIHSADESLYTVKITNQQLEQCVNGSFSQTYPSFCICDSQYYASACQISSTYLQPDKPINIDTYPMSSNIITIPINQNSLQLDVAITSDSPIESMIGCYLQKEYLPFSGSLGYDLHTIQQGFIKFYQADIQECNRIYHQINTNLKLQLQPKLALLINNPHQKDVQVNLFVDQMIPENVANQFDLRLIILSAFLLFWMALIMLYCLKYFFGQKQQNLNISQNRSNIRTGINSCHKKQLSLDFIPSKQYEKIIEQYPALKDTDCQICLIEFEKNDLVKLTYCLHIFHSTCLNEWRQRNQICPFCRDELTKSKYQENENINRIYQLGVVNDNDIIIDEKKMQEIAKREERLKQLKILPSAESVTSIQEVSPSPQQEHPLKPKQEQYKLII